MKSKELKVHNLPAEDVLLSQIDAKPVYLFYFLILLGFLTLIFKIPILFGATCILASITMMLVTPKVILIQFFQDYLVIFNKADRNTCVLIYYDEISSWYYTWGANHDYLYIELENGQMEKIEGFSKTLFESQMNRFLKEKHKKIK